jgi:hypothetical protein
VSEVCVKKEGKMMMMGESRGRGREREENMFN